MFGHVPIKLAKIGDSDIEWAGRVYVHDSFSRHGRAILAYICRET